MSLFVAILLNPDLQKKAQDELDSVIGRERLPTFEDRPRLPFINAVCKETLRWNPTTPLGVFPQYVFGVSRHNIYNILIGSCPTRGHEGWRLFWLFHTKGWALYLEWIWLFFAHAYVSGASVIANSWWATSFHMTIKQLERLSGRYYMILLCILSRMPSNQSDSWIQMGVCVMIPSWHQRLDTEDGYVPEGTLSMRHCSSLSHLYSQFSISKEGKLLGGSILTIRLQGFSWGSYPNPFWDTQRLIFLLSSRPNPFACSFIPRDEKAREIVLADTMARWFAAMVSFLSKALKRASVTTCFLCT